MSDKPPVIKVTQVHKGCGSGCGTGCAGIILIFLAVSVLSPWLKKDATVSHAQLPTPASTVAGTDTPPTQPTTKPAAKPLTKGDHVSLLRDTPLYLRDSVYRQGAAGEEFEVADYRPDTKKVFLLSRGFDGKPLTFNISPELVELVHSSSP